ncbi:MAG: hypothetical protein ACRC9L_10120 [Brevinema sp.]
MGSSMLEEEVIDLQKDFVVYLLFTCSEIEDLQRINFYCEEFKEIILRSGSLSEKGLAYIEQFCENLRILLANTLQFDSSVVRLELVKGISAHAFTKAILFADSRYSDAEHNASEELLNKIISDCMEKSRSLESQTG